MVKFNIDFIFLYENYKWLFSKYWYNINEIGIGNLKVVMSGKYNILWLSVVYCS